LKEGTIAIMHRAVQRARLSRLFVVLACTVCAPACDNQEPKTALSYTDNARRAYDAAMVEFDAKNWLEAVQRLREVKRKYAYSK